MSTTALDRIETQNLVCERVQMSQAEEVSRLLLDPQVGRWIWPGTEPPSEQEILSGLADKVRHWERHGFGLWLLRDRRTGEMVGRGGLQWTYATDIHEVEAAWAIVSERWGQGLATELALASVEAGFQSLGLERIIAFTLPENVASRRVMEKAGFTYDSEIVHVGLPHVLYSRTR